MDNENIATIAIIWIVVILITSCICVSLSFKKGYEKGKSDTEEHYDWIELELKDLEESECYEKIKSVLRDRDNFIIHLERKNEKLLEDLNRCEYELQKQNSNS